MSSLQNVVISRQGRACEPFEKAFTLGVLGTEELLEPHYKY